MPTSMPSPELSVSFDDVRAAADRLRGVAHRTPVVTSRTIDERTGARVFLKAENLQRIGAFKFRGAYNALSRLDDDARRRGVLTYSSGNHAQAVALAGALLGVPTVIVMPTDAPKAKLAATRGYIETNPARAHDPDRCRVVEYDRTVTTREELGAKLAGELGMVIVPPYDHPDVIAGQGTAALELFEEVGELDVLFVCCGGGGLLSGSAIAARGCSGGCCRVVGVEPELADDATRSFRTGTLHTVHNPPTIADGARTPSLGQYTFPIVLDAVSEMRTVSEQQIAAAMRFCMERLKLVVEPSGALGLAGLFSQAVENPAPLAGRRVGVIISGGNVDLDDLPRLFAIAAGEV